MTKRRVVRGKIMDKGPTSPLSSCRKYSMAWQILLETLRRILRASSAAACMAAAEGGNSPNGEGSSGDADGGLSADPGVDDEPCEDDVSGAVDGEDAEEADSDRLPAAKLVLVAESTVGFETSAVALDLYSGDSCSSMMRR